MKLTAGTASLARKVVLSYLIGKNTISVICCQLIATDTFSYVRKALTHGNYVRKVSQGNSGNRETPETCNKYARRLKTMGSRRTLF